VLYFKQENNQRDIFTHEITPVEIGETVAKVKLLIVACMLYQSCNTEFFLYICTELKNWYK